MSRPTSIGGRLTGDAYALLANQHRPTDPVRIAAEVKRLHTEQHLTAIDISTALRLSCDQVRNILASTLDEVPQQ